MVKHTVTLAPATVAPSVLDAALTTLPIEAPSATETPVAFNLTAALASLDAETFARLVASLTAPVTPASASVKEVAGAVAPRNPKAYVGGAPLTVTIAAVTPNPKTPNTACHARYALYPAAPFTLAEALKVSGGANRADFLYDLRKGYLLVA